MILSIEASSSALHHHVTGQERSVARGAAVYTYKASSWDVHSAKRKPNIMVHTTVYYCLYNLVPLQILKHNSIHSGTGGVTCVTALLQ